MQGCLRTRAKLRRLCIEALEPRRLMAADITLYSGGSLYLRGDDTTDAAAVAYYGSDLVRVTLDGLTKHYDADQVERIYFYGYGGNDSFRNDTGVPAFADGGAGNDVLTGGGGDDSLLGGESDDVLEGRGGDDLLEGGNGHDRYVFTGGTLGADRVAGSTNGENTLDFRGRTGHVNVDLRSTAWQTLKASHLSLRLEDEYAIDHVYGTPYDDEIIGNALANTLYGMGGHDKIYGMDGDDEPHGGDGDDLVSGNDGNDLVTGGTGDDVTFGGLGRDRIFGGEGLDDLFGGAGRDDLYGGPGDDDLQGQDGNDGLFGGYGNDDLTGGAGADRFLLRGGYSLIDRTSEDAAVYFLSGDGGSWTDAEIEALDEGLRFYHERTGDGTFLRDTLSGDDLRVYKASTDQTWVGLNKALHEDGHWHRELYIADFDESNATQTLSRTRTLVHEISHNWDNESDKLTGAWSSFLAKSGWTQSQKAGYLLSGDGKWWYNPTATFAREYGKKNPYEDFATTMEVYFDQWRQQADATAALAQPVTQSGLDGKLDVIDGLFEQMA